MLATALAALLWLAAGICGGLGAWFVVQGHAALGLLVGSFGLLFLAIGWALARAARPAKGERPPARFVPHRQLMTMLALTALLVLLAIVIPALLR